MTNLRWHWQGKGPDGCIWSRSETHRTPLHLMQSLAMGKCRTYIRSCCNRALMLDSIRMACPPSRHRRASSQSCGLHFSGCYAMQLYVIYLGCRSFGGLQRGDGSNHWLQYRKTSRGSPSCQEGWSETGAAPLYVQQPRRRSFRIITIAA